MPKQIEIHVDQKATLPKSIPEIKRIFSLNLYTRKAETTMILQNEMNIALRMVTQDCNVSKETSPTTKIYWYFRKIELPTATKPD